MLAFCWLDPWEVFLQESELYVVAYRTVTVLFLLLNMLHTLKVKGKEEASIKYGTDGITRSVHIVLLCEGNPSVNCDAHRAG